MVKATVNGKGRIVDLKIDPSVLKACQVDMLEDMIKAAVSAAQSRAADAAAAAVKELTGGLNLPGMEGMMP